jgi:hypothetical protein
MKQAQRRLVVESGGSSDETPQPASRIKGGAHPCYLPIVVNQAARGRGSGISSPIKTVTSSVAHGALGNDSWHQDCGLKITKN